MGPPIRKHRLRPRGHHFYVIWTAMLLVSVAISTVASWLVQDSSLYANNTNHLRVTMMLIAVLLLMVTHGRHPEFMKMVLPLSVYLAGASSDALKDYISQLSTCHDLYDDDIALAHARQSYAISQGIINSQTVPGGSPVLPGLVTQTYFGDQCLGVRFGKTSYHAQEVLMGLELTIMIIFSLIGAVTIIFDLPVLMKKEILEERLMVFHAQTAIESGNLHKDLIEHLQPHAHSE